MAGANQVSGKHPRRRKRRRRNNPAALAQLAPANTTQTVALSMPASLPVASLPLPAVPLSTIRERFKLLHTPRSANG